MRRGNVFEVGARERRLTKRSVRRRCISATRRLHATNRIYSSRPRNLHVYVTICRQRTPALQRTGVAWGTLDTEQTTCQGHQRTTNDSLSYCEETMLGLHGNVIVTSVLRRGTVLFGSNAMLTVAQGSLLRCQSRPDHPSKWWGFPNQDRPALRSPSPT